MSVLGEWMVWNEDLIPTVKAGWQGWCRNGGDRKKIQKKQTTTTKS